MLHQNLKSTEGTGDIQKKMMGPLLYGINSRWIKDLIIKTKLNFKRAGGNYG